MSRAVRAAFALGLLLAAFGALSACGQRGPLTLPQPARPSARTDPGKAAPTAGPQGAQSNEGAQAAPANGATSPEDEERRDGK